MMVRLKSIFVAAMAICLISCGRNSKVNEPYLPLVKLALTDTSCAEHHILENYVRDNVSGSIAVIGDFDPVCGLISECLKSDRFDNIDGRESSDELHDFAGETFSPVFDIANAPYDGYMDAENIQAMREAAVTMAIASMGSVSYANTFDTQMLASRTPAKILIVDSPYLCTYAVHDIDTMLVSHGINMPVLSATDELFKRAGERHKKGLVVMFSDGKTLDYGLYGTVYKRVKGEDEAFPEYMEYADSCPDSRTALHAFLDSYTSSGSSKKISAILVGNSSDSLNVSALNEALKEIQVSQGLDMENYRAVLANDFEFISSDDAVIRACYRELRKRNLFTHRISYPAVKAFVTVPSAEVPLESVDFGGTLSAKYKYNHSADASVRITRVVPLNRLYMDEHRLAKVNSLVAPAILNMERLTD